MQSLAPTVVPSGSVFVLPPQGAPQRIHCLRRPNVEGGIGPSLARALYRPNTEPCASCTNLTRCQTNN